MCVEFNCVEQNNIDIRTIVRHCTTEVTKMLH